MTLKQKILLSLAILAILSTSLLIVFGENGLGDHRRLRLRHEQLVGQNQAMTRENARLYHQIERLRNDPAFIETIARQELGMIGSREIIVKPLRTLRDIKSAGRPIDPQSFP